jgi:fructuronate reductase
MTHMHRLSDRTLHRLDPAAGIPAYDRTGLQTGIVHLGAGAFHRSHQAWYTDRVLADGDRRWGISAVSLRNPWLSQTLAPQDGLYGLLVKHDAGPRIQVIGSLAEALCLATAPDTVGERLRSPATRIVSLTITEKGYCHEPATGTLDAAHPGIEADLRQPRAPRTAIGLIALAIHARKTRGLAPFTLLSCDNLPANGRTLRRVLADYLERAGPALGDADLARHFLARYACPCTMVDRITPATTAEDRATAARLLSAQDAAPVVTEPFSQWVIEDRFCADRPAWENAGALFTEDVAPFETLKLRILNGSHSALAYLGMLAGHATIAQAMADELLARFIVRLMDDAASTLDVPPGLDLDSYRASVLARFRNGALAHRTAQIAMDGSQKLPQRILSVVRQRLARGQDIGPHALVVAAWTVSLLGTGDAGSAPHIDDPLAEVFAAARTRAGGSADAFACAILGMPAIFGRDLAENPAFTAPVLRTCRELAIRGVRATVYSLFNEEIPSCRRPGAGSVRATPSP